MYIISSFEHSIYLELALSSLEQHGIVPEQIFAIPLKKRDSPHLFDTIHHSNGTSLFDTGMLLATFFTVVGSSIGFVLTWGPIICGIIAAICGFGLGLWLDLIWQKKRTKNLKESRSEVFVLVQCPAQNGDLIEKILWSNHALGVAKVEMR